MNNTDQNLYPLDLSLHRIKKIWGGWPGKVGEIWSLSGPPHESLVLNGALAGQRLTRVVGEFHERLLGEGMELDPREPFPMLLKFVSTEKNTGIHVHPDDAYTLKQGLPMIGKDKIWYILNVSPGAAIYSGFKNKVSEKTIKEACENNSLHLLLNRVSVKPGDLFTLPAGRIHAIGKGVVLFEIQNHSEITYRLSACNRDTDTGKNQTYQIDKALEVLAFNPTTPKPIPKAGIRDGENRINYLTLTPHFTFRRISVRNSLELSFSGNRMTVFTGIKGSGWLKWGLTDIYVNMQPYQSVLVPAISEEIYFETEDSLEMLETSIPVLSGDTLEGMLKVGLSKERIIALGGDDYGGILKAYLDY